MLFKNTAFIWDRKAFKIWLGAHSIPHCTWRRGIRIVQSRMSGSTNQSRCCVAGFNGPTYKTAQISFDTSLFQIKPPSLSLFIVTLSLNDYHYHNSSIHKAEGNGRKIMDTQSLEYTLIRHHTCFFSSPLSFLKEQKKKKRRQPQSQCYPKVHVTQKTFQIMTVSFQRVYFAISG